MEYDYEEVNDVVLDFKGIEWNELTFVGKVEGYCLN